MADYALVIGCDAYWSPGSALHGAVGDALRMRSWLLDLLVLALKDDPELAKLSDYVDDSGEGRWTIEEAIRHAVPLPVISAALFARFSSRQESSPSMRAVAALRHQFGGHAVHAAGPSGTPGQLAGPSSGTGSSPRGCSTGRTTCTGAGDRRSRPLPGPCGTCGRSSSSAERSGVVSAGRRPRSCCPREPGWIGWAR